MAYTKVTTTVTTERTATESKELSAARVRSVNDRRKLIAADDRGNQSEINFDEDFDYGPQVRAINRINTIRSENSLVQSVMIDTPVPRPVYGGSG